MYSGYGKICIIKVLFDMKKEIISAVATRNDKFTNKINYRSKLTQIFHYDTRVQVCKYAKEEAMFLNNCWGTIL